MNSPVHVADNSVVASNIRKVISKCFFAFTDIDRLYINDNKNNITIDYTVDDDKNNVLITLNVALTDPVSNVVVGRNITVSQSIDTIKQHTTGSCALIIDTTKVRKSFSGTATLNRCCCMYDHVPIKTRTTSLSVASPINVQQTDQGLLLTADPAVDSVRVVDNQGVLCINGLSPVNGDIRIVGAGKIAVNVNSGKRW